MKPVPILGRRLGTAVEACNWALLVRTIIGIEYCESKWSDADNQTSPLEKEDAS